MAIYYVDFTNGNDGSAGTSFATRKKTIASALSAASDGDTIRVMQSPAPVSTGLTVTLVHDAYSITVSSATNQAICTCETAWTPATNVTCATANPLVFGTYSSQVAVGSAFTTGKAAYFDLGASTDFSGFQIVNLTCIVTSGTVGATFVGAYKLQLCSDATGDTPIAGMDIPIPRVNSLDNSFPIVWDYGAALPNNVRSIRLFVNTDRGAVTFRFDHIFASKAASSADSITLKHLVGGPNAKGAGGSDSTEWYAINTLNSTTLYLEQFSVDYKHLYPVLTTQKVYKDPGQAGVTLYKRSVLELPATEILTKTGLTSGILVSGGWDTTAMSSQTGYTYIRPAVNSGVLFQLGASTYRLNFEKFGFLGAAVGIGNSGDSSGSITDCAFYCCSTGASLYGIEVTNCFFQAMVYAVFTSAPGANNPVNVNKLTSCSFVCCMRAVDINATQMIADGCFFYPQQLVNTSLYVFGGASTGTYLKVKNTTIEVETLGGTSVVTVFSNVKSVVLETCTITGTGTRCSVFGNTSSAEIYNTTFSTFEWYGSNVYAAWDHVAYSCTVTSITSMMVAPQVQYSHPATSVKFCNYNGSYTDHRVFNVFGTITAETTVRHTASGLAWKISPTLDMDTLSAFGGLKTKIRIPVVTGSQSIKLWMRRTNTGITAGFRILGYAVHNVSEATATMTASADTWEELSLTINPSTAGVLLMEVFAYGGTTYSAYFDDLTVNGVAQNLDLFDDTPTSPLPSSSPGTSGARLVGPSALVG